MTIIMGFDPGSTNIGICTYNTNTHTVLDATEIINKHDVFEDKLVNIDKIITDKLSQHKVNVFVYEQPVFMNRGDTGEKLNRALGVVLTLLRKQGANIFSYSPKRIKKDVTGSGNADKKQVSEAVAKFFNIADDFNTSHASDSLACVITYLKDKNLV